ncbi:CHAT domain-containing protein [Actinomadura sp. 9N215]|uniref:CHAT domain-containing tetratricopeptide repeat protein n=1 Tax=Actinomadura sp. 9N215 TaxID=3375150 RepID=UPI0037A69070
MNEGNRARRARAAIADRLALDAWPDGAPTAERRALERIGDDPSGWLRVARGLIVQGKVPSRSEAQIVAALMGLALEETPPDDGEREDYVRYYGAALATLAEQYGDLGAILEHERVTSAEAERHPRDSGLRWLIYNLSERMASLYVERAPGPEATDLLINARLRLVAHMDPDDPEAPPVMAMVGDAFRHRFEEDGDRAMASEAVRWTRRALECADSDHPELGELLHSARHALSAQCQRTDRVPELTEAVALAGRAVQWCAERGLPTWNLRFELAQSLADLYEANHNRAVIDESIGHFRSCLAEHPDGDDLARADLLSGLGNALRSRYRELGRPDDLEDAIATLRRAVDVLPDGHPRLSSLRNDLSGFLYYKHELTGDERVHDESIAVGRAAVVPGDLSPRGLRSLNNLGANLLARFHHTRDSRILDEAIGLFEQCVDASPEGDPELPSRLNNLGEALSSKYLQSGAPEALDRSIDLGRRALASLSSRAPHDGERCGFASRLGVRLRARYLRTGDPADIEEAATLLRSVAAALPEANPDRPIFLMTTVAVLEGLYRETPRPDLLDEAIATARSALAHLAPGHPSEQGLTMALAYLLSTRAGETGDRECAREARSLYHAAVRLPAPPTNQIACHRLAAVRAMEDGDWKSATDLLEGAISLLPQLASKGLVVGDQERLLKDITGLAQHACASAIRAGDPLRALTLLEHGRGTLLAQLLETRSDITELQKRHPRLTERLEDLRVRLADPLGSRTSADDHHALARQWDRLIEEIRTLPGFARFLLPPTAAELLAAAREGPVVLLSVSEFGSDALLLTAAGLDVVPLPGATPAAVDEQARAFLATRGAGPAAEGRDEQIGRTLEWIWDVIAEPVLERLDLPAATVGDGTPSRLWWCPTGPLSLLPLHAAGHHRASPSRPARTVLDRVMSSYTPTVRALLHARRQPSAAGEDGGDARSVRVLMVPMPRTSGATDLPGVTAESERLRGWRSGQVTELRPDDVHRDRVLGMLAHHDAAHFACHALSDPDRPSKSHLLLSDHENRPLTVMDIAALRLTDAKFAYLSACSTARAEGPLADEAIHLASAFQLAGYRSVIATLWPTLDRPAARFAAGVYDTIGRHGVTAAAYALHVTTLRLRERYPRNPEVWAGYAHVGA